MACRVTWSVLERSEKWTTDVFVNPGEDVAVAIGRSRGNAAMHEWITIIKAEAI